MTQQEYQHGPAQPMMSHGGGPPPGYDDRAKPITHLTKEELRRVIQSGVANGVLLAGIVILLLNLALGAVLAGVLAN